MNHEDYRHILRRVGISLIVFGALDIGFMVYCIMHRMSYSSSFNIFAVISGIYVWRGHPWYLKMVPRAAAFFVGGFGSALIIFPALIPLDLQIAVFRMKTLDAFIGLVAILGVVALLCWVYRQLRAPPVRQYYEQIGLPTKAPVSAFFLGVAIAVVGAGLLYWMAHSADARRAAALAQTKAGSGYRYWVSSISWAGEHGSALVYAYDKRAVKDVHVEW